MNAIISSSRKNMIGASLYLVQYRTDTGLLEENPGCCQMCRKLIINAGIERVIVRDDSKEGYKITDVQEWIDNDDLLNGKITY